MLQLNKVDIANYRGIEQLEFDLKTGVNVIAGQNGTGKSAILTALTIVISKILPEMSPSQEQPRYFDKNDVQVDNPNLRVAFEGKIAGLEFRAVVVRESEEEIFVQERLKKQKDTGDNLRTPKEIQSPSDDLSLTPADTRAKQEQFTKSLADSSKSPLPPVAIYYSTRRAYLRTERVRSARTGQAGAYFEALTPNQINLRFSLDWYRVKVAFAENTENLELAAQNQAQLETLNLAITTFLDEISNLRYEHKEDRFIIDKRGVTLDVRQLSDGERGVLGVVLDLARRLSIAFPESLTPLHEQAVVLIDELDLHLHPLWQRQIVGRLEETFPKCQFIVTTHSPQIIGQVQAENLIYLKYEDGRVYREPIGQAFGKDTNWVLRDIMGTPERDPATKEEIDTIFNLIEGDEFAEARKRITALRQRLQGDDVELVEASVLIDRITHLGE